MSRIARLVRGERQKELVKVFDEACGRHNRWEVWSDAIVMYAIAISNSMDKSHYDSREKMYMNIVQKYNKREMDCISRMFALIVEAIDQNPDQDFLGDLFMSLELGNQKGGQFFTPYCVCKLMAKMQTDIQARVEKNGWIGVNDPACGAGALLVAFANECLMQKVNYQTSVLFVAQDIDLIAGCMCYIQLSLLGCPGYVVIANTITHPATCIDGRGLIPVPGENVWYTPFYFGIRAIANAMDSYGDLDWKLIAEILDITYDEDEDRVDPNEFGAIIKENPAYALFATACGACVDEDDKYWRTQWNGGVQEVVYDSNDTLDILYQILCRLGYEMSDEEKAMQNGTHSVFCSDTKEGDDSENEAEN